MNIVHNIRLRPDGAALLLIELERTGPVVRVEEVEVREGDPLYPACQTVAALLADGDENSSKVFVIDAAGGVQAQDVPACPDQHSSFDYDTWTWSDTRSPEEIAQDEALVQNERRKGVDAERARRLVLGASFTVSWRDDPIPMTGRPFDQTVVLGLLQRAMAAQAQGVTVPAITYRDASNVIHELTPAQFIELGSMAMSWVEAVMAASWALKDGAAIPADFADDQWWP